MFMIDITVVKSVKEQDQPNIPDISLHSATPCPGHRYAITWLS